MSLTRLAPGRARSVALLLVLALALLSTVALPWPRPPRQLRIQVEERRI